MRLHRTTLGHALGYAEFIVESAGQEQALSRINFVPYPSQMYQEILALIFSPKRSGGNGGDLALDWVRGIAWHHHRLPRQQLLVPRPVTFAPFLRGRCGHSHA